MPSATTAGTVPQTVDALAPTQRGLVAGWQLRQDGHDQRRVRSLARAWTSVHPGVYLVEGQLDWRTRLHAAVLAGGPKALAATTRLAGAELHGLREARGKRVEVVFCGSQARPGGVITWRASDLRPEEVVRVDGVPCTSVARTLLDLTALCNRAELRAMITQARRRGVLDIAAFEAQLARHRGHRGAGTLRDLVRAMPDRTESDLEDETLRLLRAAGLDAGLQVNHTFDAAGRWVRTDFRWPGRCIVLEVDGYEHHSSPAAFADDLDRQLALRRAGWDVIRVGWRLVWADPAAVLDAVRTALGG